MHDVWSMLQFAGCALLLLACNLACTGPTREVVPASPRTEIAAPRYEHSRPPELAELAAAVDELAASSDPTHGPLVAALSRLAEVLRRRDPDAAAAIDQRATELMRSPPQERSHAKLASEALSIALDSFAARLPPDPEPALQAAYVASRRALAGIDDTEPLRPQRTDVVAALRSLTNTAALLRGLPAVYAELDASTELGHDPAALVERATRASELVSELARERQWKPAGLKAARALLALADVLEVAPLSIGRHEWKVLVAAVRYEAFELEREGAISLERSGRVKAALLACTRAFEHVDRAGARAFDVLARAAHEAASAIDAPAPFVFQRAAIQEAFRAVADAYVVLAHGIADARLSVRRLP